MTDSNKSPCSEDWLNCLQESGYRLTAPRRAIVEIMAHTQRALNPIQLYDLGRKTHPHLGLVTVYRTLEKLEELALIQRVHQPDGCNMYLPAAHGHEHLLLCTGCGLVETFRGDDLSRLISRTVQETGYEIQEHWLQLFGLCPACKLSTTRKTV
jgi:Fur family ferric uptake transcriptional regulator